MIVRTVCVVLAVALSATAVVAQSKAIGERKEIMKGVGAAAKGGAAMARGSAPYDNAKAIEVFAVYANAAEKMPVCSRMIPRPAARPRRPRKSGKT